MGLNVHTSRRSVSAVLNQYFNAMNGLNSKSWAFAEISLTLMGLETWRDGPAMVAFRQGYGTVFLMSPEATEGVFHEDSSICRKNKETFSCIKKLLLPLPSYVLICFASEVRCLSLYNGDSQRPGAPEPCISALPLKYIFNINTNLPSYMSTTLHSFCSWCLLEIDRFFYFH